jgi:phenylacetate-CoA ligase
MLHRPCPCGRPYPRISYDIKRTDNRLKVRGVNVFPGAVEYVLDNIEAAAGEYTMLIDPTPDGDEITLMFETDRVGEERVALEAAVAGAFKSNIGLRITARAAEIGSLARSIGGKTKRVQDNRQL